MDEKLKDLLEYLGDMEIARSAREAAAEGDYNALEAILTRMNDAGFKRVKFTPSLSLYAFGRINLSP